MAPRLRAYGPQTMRKFRDGANTALLLEHPDRLVREQTPTLQIECLRGVHAAGRAETFDPTRSVKP